MSEHLIIVKCKSAEIRQAQGMRPTKGIKVGVGMWLALEKVPYPLGLGSGSSHGTASNNVPTMSVAWVSASDG